MSPDLVNIATPVGMLLTAIVTGAKGLWVFGREFEQMRKDRDEWRTMALQALDLGKTATKVAEAKVLDGHT